MSNLSNRMSVTFSNAEINIINSSIEVIGNVLKKKLVILSAEDRQQFGRLSAKTEEFVIEAASIMEEESSVIPNLLDTMKFDNNWKAYNSFKNILNQLEPLSLSIEDSLKQLGFDLLQDTNILHNYLTFLVRNNQEGSKNILKRLDSKNPQSAHKPHQPCENKVA